MTLKNLNPLEKAFAGGNELTDYESFLFPFLWTAFHIGHTMFHLWQIILHLLHGIFPSWSRIEKRVETDDNDHKPGETKGRRGYRRLHPRNYLKHFYLNMKCAVRHLVLGLFHFITEVEFS